ncbi:MAG: hypothetical protein P4L83_08415 [Nevskia sp.]|nr:hypothetical protein [Nevskia sp.]
MRPVSWVAIGLAAALVAAQAGAEETQPKPKHRHAAAAKTAPAAAAEGEGPGTTIIGDRESPIGLYLTPWKNEYAERGMDRPAQFVQEQMAPVDPGEFHRQIEYYDVITVYRQAELGAKK